MNESDSEDKFVYWEKQGKDRLWGLHWLNSLVQGPLFNESNLCTIALELDQLERGLYEGEAPPTPTNQDDGTNNIAPDGNYNVQVLTKALENCGSYEIETIDKPGVMDPAGSFADEQAFMWNSVDHWFAIRKVHDTWFNLNSTNIEPGPQIISDFYLDAFLISVKSSGYTIFVIRGENLPLPNKEENKDNLRSNQYYIGANYLRIHYENNKNRQLNIDGADESEMEAAIKASLDDYNIQNHQFSDAVMYANENYNDQILRLTGSGNQNQNEDDELAMAIALSLQMSGQADPSNSGAGQN